MYNMQILFDHPDGVYRMGEEVTGRVILEAAHDSNVGHVHVTYGWRTHGRGDRDQGPEQMLELASDRVSLRKGERREFPFRFDGPVGPVTYHGHEINVDWYVTAHAGTAPLSSECEQDFLLLAAPPAQEVVLGNTYASVSEFPRWSPSAVSKLQPLERLDVAEFALQPTNGGMDDFLRALGIFILLAGGAAFLWAVPFEGGAPAWIALAAAGLIYLLVRIVSATGYKRKLEVTQCCVEPEVVFAGGELICRLDFQVKREVVLRSIAASITGLERVMYTQGTAVTTKTHELSKQGSAKTFDEQLSAGRAISFECPLPVPADAPPTFKALHNQVEWSVDLRAHLGGWPGLHESFIITVVPAECAPRQ